MSENAGAHEALLLLAKAPNVSQSVFEETLRAAAPNAALAFLLPADALPALPHAAGQDPDLPDALVTLPREASANYVQSIGAMIAPERSTLFAFERHAILPGQDEILLFFGLRRLERRSHEGFCDYWLNRHAEIGRRLIPPYTYHQLHGAADATATLAEDAGLQLSSFDGVVEVHFPNVQAFVDQLSRADVASEALEDEKNFIDHARSIFWAYRVDGFNASSGKRSA